MTDMEQTEVSISEKEKAARLIKEMREQGLLRDGSFGKLALPTTEEADTMTRRPSWFAPDAVVLAPPSSICPHFGVLAVNSFVIPEDEESQRRVSLESGMETDRRAHFTESVTSEEEVQGPPPPLEQAKPAQRDLEWDSSEDDKRMVTLFQSFYCVVSRLHTTYGMPRRTYRFLLLWARRGTRSICLCGSTLTWHSSMPWTRCKS